MNRHDFAILCLLASLLACVGCNAPPNSTTGQTPSADAPKPSPSIPAASPRNKQDPPAPTPAVIELSAEAIGDEYAKDDDAAQKKYKGKAVRITAKSVTISGEVMYLNTGKRFSTGQPIKVYLRFPKDIDVKEFDDLEHVVVEGRIGSSGVFGPALEGFKVVSKKLDDAKVALRSAVIKAADLTKAYHDDAKAAKKKYEIVRSLTIEGLVKEISTNADGDPSVILAGHDQSAQIICVTFKNKESAKKTIRKGKTIKLKGNWDAGSLGMTLSNVELVD